MNAPEQHRMDDLFHALVEADALSTFQAMPIEEQERFWAWIAKASDEEGYWRRIEILVLGMRMAPRIKAPREPVPETDFWTQPTT